MDNETLSVNFLGDVMLGRLIDQLCPVHVDEPEEAKIVKSFRNRASHLANYAMSTPWGNTISLLKECSATIINLETSVTTNPVKWPNKVFNYRMHPHNIEILKAANIAYASLANNHTLDYCEEGLLETIKALDDSGILHAGVGSTKAKATEAAVLNLTGLRDENYSISIWSASDHPSEWARVNKVHLVDYSPSTRQRLKAMTEMAPMLNGSEPLKVFSIHWGPNYSWRPSTEIVSLAHFLIDECGIDIIHGHSSHHVQGVEKYNGKLIIYGCGDFVDDYAVNSEYRNDLSAIWRVTLQGSIHGLKLDKLQILPTRIQNFQAQLLPKTDPDCRWVCRKITELSHDFRTMVEPCGGDNPGLILKLC